jgi:Flp pilus assembly pilin Flp
VTTILTPSHTLKRNESDASACPDGKGGESKMSSFFQSLAVLTRREEGQTMAEYGVVLAVVTLAIVVALAALSGAISAALDAVTAIL